MQMDAAGATIDDELLTSTIDTNLVGPIRLTSALVEHLKTQKNAYIVYNTSVLAYVPLAFTAVYSATKAALHSYVLSQRFVLHDTSVKVLEIAPPWVRTELMNSSEAEQAMLLNQFVGETISLLGTNANELVVEAGKALRDNAGPNEHSLVDQFNEQMLAIFSG